MVGIPIQQIGFPSPTRANASALGSRPMRLRVSLPPQRRRPADSASSARGGLRPLPFDRPICWRCVGARRLGQVRFLRGQLLRRFDYAIAGDVVKLLIIERLDVGLCAPDIRPFDQVLGCDRPRRRRVGARFRVPPPPRSAPRPRATVSAGSGLRAVAFSPSATLIGWSSAALSGTSPVTSGLGGCRPCLAARFSGCCGRVLYQFLGRRGRFDRLGHVLLPPAIRVRASVADGMP